MPISYPRTASEAIAVGLAVYEASDKVAKLDASGQTTVVLSYPCGISGTEATADGDEICVYGNGEPCMAIAGAAISAYKPCVAQEGTGRLIEFAVATYTDGQIVNFVGHFCEDVSGDGVRGRFEVNLNTETISKPA